MRASESERGGVGEEEREGEGVRSERVSERARDGQRGSERETEGERGRGRGQAGLLFQSFPYAALQYASTFTLQCSDTLFL